MHLTLWISKMHKPILNLPEKSNKLVRSWGHPRFWGFIWFYDNWGWPQRLKPSGGEYLSMVRSTQPISSLYRKGGAHCLDSSVVLWASRFFKIVLLCIRALPVSCHSMWKLRDFQKLVQSSCPKSWSLYTIAYFSRDRHLPEMKLCHFTSIHHVNERCTVLRSSETGQGRARDTHHLDLDLEKHSGCRGKFHSWHILSP